MKLLSIAIIALSLGLPAFADNETDATSTSVTPVNDILPIWQPTDVTQINFKVLRKGKPFGRHIINFQPDGNGGFTATNDIDLKVKFGPITAYSYRHDSVETWKDGRLVGLEAKTHKEGGDLVAKASLGEDGLSVTGTNYSGTYRSDIVPATHWNIGQLYRDTMLSTEGGQALDVMVENLGRETLTIDGEEITATKFKLVSDLTVFLWYDDNGRWVRLDFTARGDQKIEYILEDLYG